MATVEADRGPVEKIILDDLLREHGVFVGLTHSLGIEDQRTEGFLRLFYAHALIGERQERTRCDGHRTDTQGGKVAGEVQGHGDDPALGRAIGNLSRLPFETGDGSRVDDNPRWFDASGSFLAMACAAIELTQ